MKLLNRVKAVKDTITLEKDTEVEFNDVTVISGDQGSGKSSLCFLIRNFDTPDTKGYVEYEFNEEVTDTLKDISVRSRRDSKFASLLKGDETMLRENIRTHILSLDTRTVVPEHMLKQATIEKQIHATRLLRNELLVDAHEAIDSFKKKKPELKELLSEEENNIVESMGKKIDETIVSYYEAKKDVGSAYASGDDMVDKQVLLHMQKSHGEGLLPMMEAFRSAKGRLILFDEPETSLSTANQYKVAQWIVEMSKDNQIIICTHSSPIMSYLEEKLDTPILELHKNGKPEVKSFKTFINDQFKSILGAAPKKIDW